MMAKLRESFRFPCRAVARARRRESREMTIGRPTRHGVEAAAARIAGAVTRTPLLPFEVGGTRLWAKAECLQQGGSFKLRGATNRFMLISPEERKRGVVAFSSGNHAQGVAIAAKIGRASCRERVCQYV